MLKAKPSGGSSASISEFCGAEYPPMLETLKDVEQMTDETDTPMVRALDGEHAGGLDLQKVSKELYEVLVTIREGETKLVVKNVLNNDGV